MTVACQICAAELDGDPFTRSTPTDPPKLLQVCSTCATAEYTEIEHDGIRVRVRTDDLLRANRERMNAALGRAFCALEDAGWALEAVQLRALSDQVEQDPADG